MNCNIYHTTELLHACSNMIHRGALLGLHHRGMPICLGNQKVKTLGWRGEHDPKNEGGVKVHSVHFYLMTVEKAGEKR